MRIEIAALALPVAALAAQDQPPLEERFYRAFYAENGLRDFERAAKEYGEVHLAARAAERKDLAVKALLGRARCMRTLGKPDEAKAALDGVRELDPENEEARAAADAPADEGGGDQNLDTRIRWLVLTGLLQNTSDARRELVLLGDRCLPTLATALRARDLVLVETAANHLAALRSPRAAEILVKAMGDPEVVFRDAIAQAVTAPMNTENTQWVPFSSAEIPVLSAAAGFPSAATRAQVVTRLLYKGDPLGDAGMALLLRLATDPERFVRMAVLDRADDVDPGVVLGLETALRRSMAAGDDEERRAALVAAGRYTATQARMEDAMRALLRDPDAGTRDAAFSALQGRLTEADLAGLLDPSDSTLAARAMVQLRSMAPWSPGTAAKVREAVERMIAGEYDDRTAKEILATVQVPRWDPPTLVDLFAKTGTANTSARRGHLGTLRTAILNQLSSNQVGWNDPSKRDQIEALVEEGVEKCLPSGEALVAWVAHWSNTPANSPRSWLRAAGSPHDRARQAAYLALQKYHLAPPYTPAKPVRYTIESFPHLHEDLVAEAADLRAAARWVAYRTPSPSLAGALRALLEREQQPEERANLLRALVAAAGREAEAAVRADLARPETRDWALALLVNELGYRDRAELDAFVQAGGDPSVVVCLAGRPNPPSRALLREFANDLPVEKYTGGFLPVAASLVEGTERTALLRRALGSDAPMVRRTAAQLAGDMRMLDLWPDLLLLLDHGDSFVRAAAEKSLTALKAYAELKSSVARLGKDDEDQALRSAEALLKDPDPLKRKGAVLAVAALGDRSAVPVLLKALEDENLAVREAALAALERLGGKPEAK